MISFEQAKSIAEDEAKNTFQRHKINIKSSCLSNFYLEEEACWMFFRREDIEIPLEKWPADVTFVVCKKTGELKGVGYSENLEDNKESNKVLSDYFLKKNKSTDLR